MVARHRREGPRATVPLSEYHSGPPGFQGHGRAPAAAQSSTKSQYSKMALGPLKRHMVA